MHDDSASTSSCGGATTRTTRAPARTRVSTCASCSTTATRPSCSSCSPATAAELYDFDLDALAPLGGRVGPTVAEIAQPLDRAAREAERGAAEGREREVAARPRARIVSASPSLPVELDELSAPWFASVLDRDVTEATVIDRSSGTTGRAQVALRGEPGLPASVFVKLPPVRREAARVRRHDRHGRHRGALLPRPLAPRSPCGCRACGSPIPTMTATSWCSKT